MFDQYAARARQQGSNQLSGKDVWRLYDTYGFPVDLTRLMAEELDLEFSDAEFDEAQAHSKEASKVLKREVTDVVKLDVHDIAVLEKNSAVPKTDDSAKFRAFVTIGLSRVRIHSTLLDSTRQHERQSCGCIP